MKSGGKYAGQFLGIRKLRGYQHYTDRNPPWVKLHQSMLEDYDFASLPDATKYHAIASILLASRCENRIPADPRWIQHRLNATDQIDLDALVNCGFFEVYSDASGTLAEGLRDASKPLERAEQSRGERGPLADRKTKAKTPGEGKTIPDLPGELDDEIFRSVLTDWLAYKSERREPYKPMGLRMLVSGLEKRGLIEATAALLMAMERGWKGPAPAEALQRDRSFLDRVEEMLEPEPLPLKQDPFLPELDGRTAFGTKRYSSWLGCAVPPEEYVPLAQLQAQTGFANRKEQEHAQSPS